MKNFLFLLTGAALIISGCRESAEKAAMKKQAELFTENIELDKETGEAARNLFTALPAAAENPENLITEEKIKLGRVLYFDTRLSREGNVSCNTCHVLSTYGVDNLALSKGDAGINGDRNSPSVYNAALHAFQFWDGRAKDVEEQAGLPILEADEMAIPDPDFLIRRLSGIELYQTLFARAFPEDKNPVTWDNMCKAIGVFERTLILPSSFDEYLKGKNNALSPDEKKGLQVFIGSGCVSCHSGSLLGGNQFHKFGLYEDYWTYTKSPVVDEGRFKETRQMADKYVFKVPSLRQVAMTYPYFHDGSVMDLGESVKIIARLNLNKDLTDEETRLMVIFLNTLSGEIPLGAGDLPEELKTEL